MAAKFYDLKCWLLAEQFLEDEPNLDTKDGRDDLAKAIQTAIDDWLEAARSNYEPPDPPGFEGGFAENH